MINDDTIKLLRECNAGVKMGVDSIEQVCERVTDSKFRHLLESCKEEHQRLGSRTHELLNRYQDGGKDPNPMAKTMSWVKTNVMLSLNDNDDETIADLITDGCNMGVKSLNRYLNKYEGAEEKAKDITKDLINLEEHLAIDIRRYL